MIETENVDRVELEKFSSRATQWWKPDGEFKTLHDINPARLSFVENNTSLQNANVLDIGCGGGILSEAMAKQGAIVTGLDASEENIDIATEHATTNKLNIEYFATTAEAFAESHQIGLHDVFQTVFLNPPTLQ